jgi:hypothetical protein
MTHLSLLVLVSLPQAPGSSSAAGLPSAWPVDDVSVQFVDLPAEDARAHAFGLVLDGTPIVADVGRVRVTTQDFRMRVQRADGGFDELPLADPPIFRGIVRGAPERRVSATRVAGGLQGAVFEPDGSAWFFQPLASLDPQADPRATLVYRSRGAELARELCGVAHGALPDASSQVAGGMATLPSDTCPDVTELAFDADYEYFLANGSSAANVTLELLSVVDTLNTFYERDVRITYIVPSVVVRAAEPDPFTGGDANTLLDEFVSEWNANQGGVARDTAHLVSGKSLACCTIGLAYVGVVCNTGSAYGMSQYIYDFGTHVSITGHELGHNWNCGHCADATPCNLMCGGCWLFGPNDIATVTAFRDSRACLSDSALSLTTVSPGTIEALIPGTAQTITLVGDCFPDGASVEVAGAALAAASTTLVDETTITLDMPQVAALGALDVTVIGDPSSATAQATIVEPSSPQLQSGSGDYGNLVLTGNGLDLTFAGAPGSAVWALYSTSDVPSVHTLVSLAIGDAFTDLYLIGGPYVIEPKGWTSVHLPLAPVFPAVLVWQQTVTLGQGVPIPVSNAQATLIWN